MPIKILQIKTCRIQLKSDPKDNLSIRKEGWKWFILYRNEFHNNVRKEQWIKTCIIGNNSVRGAKRKKIIKKSRKSLN